MRITARWRRTEEEVRLQDDADFGAAAQHMDRVLDDVYQQKRMHSA